LNGTAVAFIPTESRSASADLPDSDPFATAEPPDSIVPLPETRFDRSSEFAVSSTFASDLGRLAQSEALSCSNGVIAETELGFHSAPIRQYSMIASAVASPIGGLPPSGGILSTGRLFDSNLFIPESEFAAPSEEIESVTVFRTRDFGDSLEFGSTYELLDSRIHLLKSEIARQSESFALSSERPSDFGFSIPSFPIPRKCPKHPNSPL
jgi:hypothetical protein